MRRLTVALLVSVLAFGVGSFGKAQSAEEGGVVLIGDMQPLSGAAAYDGELGHMGTETAVQDINAAGGRIIGGKHYTFVTKCYDHHYTSEGGATAANKLVFGDKVKYIAAPIGSAPTLAAQAITEKNGVILLATGWHKDVLGPKKPLTFREYMSPDGFADALVRWVGKEHPEVKRVAILTANDATGYDSARAAKASWKEFGVEVFRADFFERETSDFYPYLARYINAKVDAIDMPGIASEHEGLIAKQARELGFKGMLLGNGMSPKVVADIAGKDAEGYIVRQGVPFGSKFATPAEEAWNNKYKKERNLKGDMSFLALSAYDAVWMLVKAMEVAGTVDDTKKVAEVMENLEYELPLAGVKTRYQGQETYGIKRQLSRPIYFQQYKDGKWVVVGSAMPVIP
ncbi:MAG TPA: ABC transporter substrate-binding protein [Desulfobacteraceae bacterium]|nr:ABC transporter substrate-binding protein [Desulfobacteraceae bacterium]HPJ66817.1 ABC transporter substrate-binding protein [Desulfobacteraceae bacterium]HPQ27027.1 ABC transporter substrate-binding protein [Desulfobacteraceae bacterium]